MDGHSDLEPPNPIPNLAVKRVNVPDCTALQREIWDAVHHLSSYLRLLFFLSYFVLNSNTPSQSLPGGFLI